MEKILIERQTITMPNVNFGQPVEQAPRLMIVLTANDLHPDRAHRALDSDLSLHDDFTNPSMQDRRRADVILYFRSNGKVTVFKNRGGIDGNLF